MNITSVGSGVTPVIDKPNSQLGQDQFLALLVTQLQNQDPLNPQEDKEFIAQMAQFAALEGTKNMNQSLGRIQAAAMVGKTVDATVIEDTGPRAISGKVDSVQFKGTEIQLNVGGTTVNIDKVLTIR